MMIRHILKSGIIIGLLLLLVNCNSVIYDQPTNDDLPGGKVFLKVWHGQASQFRSSPDLPGGPSINTDASHYEDRVHSLALLVFDSAPGGELVGAHFDDAGSGGVAPFFIVELTPGARDFYFVANMPMGSGDAIRAIQNKTQMDAYIDGLHALSTSLYTGAQSNEAFPMSRIYTNQNVGEGGSVYQPLPFQPDGDNKVLLVRVVANLEVNILMDDDAEVESIKLHNAFGKFNLRHGDVNSSVAQGGNLYTNTDFVSAFDLKRLTPAASDTHVKYVAYMPEALMNGASWAAAEHKPINYFELKTKSGDTYEIPIITATGSIAEDVYLDYAKNNDNPEKYNIYRNRRYIYHLKEFSNIEIYYTIDPWQKSTSEMFMGYGYNVSIDDEGKVKIQNTVDACPPHEIILVAINEATFVGGATQETFTDDKPLNSIEFELDMSTLPNSGEYLQVWYNGDLVKTFSK